MAEVDLGHVLPLWAVLPFVLLLAAIALLPLFAAGWWEKHQNKLILALCLGLPTAAYIAFFDYRSVFHALYEYAAFIVLLGSLYVVSGGLVLSGDIRATPGANVSFLASGAVLANFIGTTGASMVLIQPLLRTNVERERKWHLLVFFIFVVSNMGGLLTPLGDPPLFLGYLRGVPFVWTFRLLPVWLVNVTALLVVFYLWDRREYRRESPLARRVDSAVQIPLRLAGAHNLLFLAGILGAVFVSSPARELGMLLMAALSQRTTSPKLRAINRFTYGPIVEVAALFLGIFLTMVPALAILQARGAELGISQPWQFFWATGALSSFLDNAPTYLSFLSLAQGLGQPAEVVGVTHRMLLAISAGAVCMGANSCIGNGPNFMVKAIADEAGTRTPTFLGYMAIAGVILLPLFVLDTLIFFRS